MMIDLGHLLFLTMFLCDLHTYRDARTRVSTVPTLSIHVYIICISQVIKYCIIQSYSYVECCMFVCMYVGTLSTHMSISSPLLSSPLLYSTLLYSSARKFAICFLSLLLPRQDKTGLADWPTGRQAGR